MAELNESAIETPEVFDLPPLSSHLVTVTVREAGAASFHLVVDQENPDEAQIAKLESGLAMARKRLVHFEQRYGVSSEHFISEITAEDLDGGDDEYMHWAGEYKLMQRLEEKLGRLQKE